MTGFGWLRASRLHLTAITHDWRSEIATWIILVMASVALTVLSLIARALRDDPEAASLGGSFTVIVAISAVLAARGVIQHGLRVRREYFDLLRSVGASWRALAGLCALESLCVALFAFVPGALVAILGFPAVVRYLQQIGIGSVGTQATMSTESYLQALAFPLAEIAAVATLSAYLAVSALRRADRPISGRSLRSAFRGRMGYVLAHSSFIAGLALFAVGRFSPQGFGLALLGLIGLLIGASAVVNSVFHHVARLPLVARRKGFLRLRIVLAGYSARSGSGTVLGVTMAMLSVTLIGGHFITTDSAVRDHWHHLFPNHHVVTQAPATLARECGGDACTRLQPVTGDVFDGFSKTVPSISLDASDARELLSRSVLEGTLDGKNQGVVVTALAASSDPGLQVGASSRVTDPSSGDPLPIVAIVEFPETLGSFYIVSDSIPPDLTNQGGPLLLFTADAQRALTATPEAISVDDWIQSYPSGKVVSNSGGSGVMEAALLVAAPLGIGLALAFSARIISSTSVRRESQLLIRVGARSTSIWRLRILRALVESALPAVAAGVLGVVSITWIEGGALAMLGASSKVSMPLVVIALSGALLALALDLFAAIVGEPRPSGRDAHARRASVNGY